MEQAEQMEQESQPVSAICPAPFNRESGTTGTSGTRKSTRNSVFGPDSGKDNLSRLFHLFHSTSGTEQEMQKLYNDDLSVFTIRLQGNEIKTLYLYCCFRTTDIQKAFSLSQFDESGQFIVDLGRVKTLALAIFWAVPTL